MDNKEKQEPSFPAPYDHFNEVLASDIQHLRNYIDVRDVTKKDLEKAYLNLKDVSPYHVDFRNREATVLYHEMQLNSIDGKIALYEGKTFGMLENTINKNDVEPEVAVQLRQVLDQKVYPEKYENQIPVKEKQLADDKKSENAKDKKTEIYVSFKENQEEINNTSKEEKQADKNDYSIKLLQKKREEKEQQKSEIEGQVNKSEKSTPDKTEPIPNAGYLNYQMKYNKPSYNDKSLEDKGIETSKSKKDISKDKD